jgi:hypothetical protein
MDVEVCLWQKVGDFLGPFDEFEALACEQIAKSGIFPLLRVVETVEVKVPHRERGQFIRFDDSVGRAFDAPVDS